MTGSVAVYGAGPAGLMAAEVLSAAGLQVHLHDHKPSPARKFLLAGRGGLNLTHSEPLETLLARYGEAEGFLAPAIRAFPPDGLRAWAAGLGIDTFVGSSGRIFPVGLKATPLLRAWLRRLAGQGVVFHPRSPWPGFAASPAVLAFGGASWPHLGSDAGWLPAFRAEGIAVTPFRPANGRFLVPWTEHFARRCAGVPLKNVALSHGPHRVRGEVMISADGIEGGAIYALSRHLRDDPETPLILDLKPDLSEADVAARLTRPRGKLSTSNYLRKALGLSPVAVALLREVGRPLSATAIKAVPITITGPAAITRAISSAGGVAWSEVDAQFMLRKRPGTFIAGEMLDWEAPTGGYLLQAAFATGRAAALGLLGFLAR